MRFTLLIEQDETGRYVVAWTNTWNNSCAEEYFSQKEVLQQRFFSLLWWYPIFIIGPSIHL